MVRILALLQSFRRQLWFNPQPSADLEHKSQFRDSAKSFISGRAGANQLARRGRSASVCGLPKSTLIVGFAGHRKRASQSAASFAAGLAEIIIIDILYYYHLARFCFTQNQFTSNCVSVLFGSIV